MISGTALVRDHDARAQERRVRLALGWGLTPMRLRTVILLAGGVAEDDARRWNADAWSTLDPDTRDRIGRVVRSLVPLVSAHKPQ